MGRVLGVAVAALDVLALAALAGCANGAGPDGFPPPPDSPAATTTSATAPGPSPAPGATGTTDVVDCGAVEQARAALTDATNGELARLGIDRSDPRAFAVQVLVTSQQAAEYWTTVREAIPDGEAELRADAETVLAYWEPLNAQLDAIVIGDDSDAEIQQATDDYLAITEQHPETEVLPVQERLSAQLDAACAAPSP